MYSTLDAPPRSVFARHPAATLALINLALVLLFIVGAEVSLRASGVKTIHDQAREMPSYLPADFCTTARRNPLQVERSFLTDSEGIFKANPDWPGPWGLINSDGFRGGEFLPADDGRTTLLLLGDSFTWGVNATPLSRSFADLLEGAGYRVYNTGIPGVDPEQYARIALKYVPRLRPRVTAVFVFLGNDIGSTPMAVEPNRNLWHITNFGFLLGYDETGRYFETPEEALKHYRSTYCGDDRGVAERFLLRTALGAVLQRARASWHGATQADSSRAWVRRALSEIRDVSARYGSRFVLFLIPVKPSQQRSFNSLAENLALFDGFDPQFPQRFSEEDYRPGDDHFNNRGHLKYFQFVRKVLGP
jgi:lysophospholipase L1-like esterase